MEKNTITHKDCGFVKNALKKKRINIKKEKVLKLNKSVKYHENGNTWKELWHREDDTYYHHREDGPAYIGYYDTGEKHCEEWWVDDKRHRMDGPADIAYNTDGTVWF